MNHASVELDLLADYLCLISAKLAANYDKTKDYVLSNELSRLLGDCDKLVIRLRACAKLAALGTPPKFDDQEALLLDQLIRSTEVIDQRNDRQRNVVPFSQKAVDDAIGYLNDDTKGNPA